MFRVSLSFDNGPDAETTPQVLDTLREREVRATFFVIGRKAAAARALCEAAHAEGHWIGNHTWSHDTPLGLMSDGSGSAAEEILRTESVLADLRHPARYFRPFAGKGRGGAIGPTLLNRDTVGILQRERMTCVIWNVIAREWERPQDWVAPAANDCQRAGEAVVVLHDLPNGAMRLLPDFIDTVRAMGGEFVQAFPASCVPVDRGTLRGPLEHMIGRA
jgi:peptidoglycan/xylan/chitin deacetylase (PgdA/CDA1 family)